MHWSLGPGMAIAAIGFFVSPQQPSLAVSTGSVVVTVLEAGTRSPVAGALVTAGTHSVKTGSDGRVRIDGINAGSSWVHAAAEEHLSALVRSAWTMVGRPLRPAPDIPPRVWAAHNPDYPGTLPVTIKAGGTTELEFVLPRGGVIAGTAKAADGQPLVGGRVDILTVYEEATDLRVFATAASVTTDRIGAFRVGGLGPGEHFVRVIRDSEARSPRTVPVFHNGVTSPLKATPIVVRVGETTELQIVDPAIRPVSIKGVVLGASGQPVRGETRYDGMFARSSIDLSYEHLDERCCTDVRAHVLLNVDGQGRFETGPLLPGTYRLRSGPYSVVTVLDTTPVENLVLQHRAPATIKGRVWPRPGWGQDWNSLTVALKAVSRTHSDYLSPSTTSPAPDGTFALGSVPGTYRLSLHTPDGWAVERVRLNDGRDVIDTEFMVEPGAVLENVTVALTDRIARIAGRVTPLDLHGPVGFDVVAFPVAREHWHEGCPLFHTASTDGDGMFVVEKLLTGHDYFVALRPWNARRPPLPFERFLEDLSKAAARISVIEPRTYRVEIDLQSRQ